MDEYFKNAIAYYYNYLKKEGCDDPVRVIISNFLDTVKISNEQEDFIKKELNIEDLTVLRDINTVLNKQIKDKKYDENILRLVINENNKILKRNGG